jgi:hypothetical protein
MCTQYFTIFTLLHHFPNSSPHPPLPSSPSRTCSTLLFSDFV